MLDHYLCFPQQRTCHSRTRVSLAIGLLVRDRTKPVFSKSSLHQSPVLSIANRAEGFKGSAEVIKGESVSLSSLKYLDAHHHQRSDLYTQKQ